MVMFVDVVTLPPFGLKASGEFADAIPTGMQDKISITASRTASIFPFSFFLKLCFTILSSILELSS
jgi:hypothetical protein